MPKKSLRSVVDLFAAPRDPARRASVRPMVEALERRDLPSAATLLHISSNGRFLVDANNQPFYLVGDAAWALPAGITTGSASNPNTANYYFQTRANEGYNAVLMDADVLLGASPVGAPSRGPLDANGNPPFDAYLPGTSTYDVSTPDTAYWNNVYNIVSTAGQYGIQVLLDVYDNYNPWFTGGNSPNSTAKLNAYGQFLGQKFAGLDNIIWMVGNDYSENSAGDVDLTAVIQGIRQYDTRHLGWAMDESGATFDNTGLRQYLQLNTIYEYSTGPWRSLYLGQYNRSDFGPIFNIESGYENNTSLGVSEANLRDEHYSFLLAGATGDTYGNEFVWPFDDAWQNWQNALTSEGAHEMTYLANFVNSVPWYNLVPDQSGMVFQGVGSPTDYSGAYTTDGTLAIAYKPSTGTGSQSFIVNMGTFAGSVTAQWYDPTNGTYRTIGTFANSGTHTFNSPSGNSTGVDNDFVLVLRASATAPTAPTGVSAAAGNTQVSLTWAAPAGAVTYNIYRSTTSGSEGSTPYRTGITTTSFTDTGLTNGTTYYYQVTAVNLAGESPKSSEVSATPAAVWTYVQTNASNSAAATNALALNSATNSGDLIIVEVDWASSANFTSISDSRGNTFVQIGSEQNSSSFGAKSRLYYAKSIKGGADTITTVLSGSAAFHELYVSEYSGLDTSSPLDAYSVNVGTGSSFTSNNLTTTAANDLLYGVEIDSAVASAAAGWTTRSTFDSNVAADKTASSTGSYAFTGNSSGGFIAFNAAFKLADTSSKAPTPMPTPALVSEQRHFVGKGRQRTLVFQLNFSTALNPAVAQDTGHYHVVQVIRAATKKRPAQTVRIPVRAARYNPGNNSVTLTLGSYSALNRLQLTATGLIGATGTPAATIVTKL